MSDTDAERRTDDIWPARPPRLPETDLLLHLHGRTGLLELLLDILGLVP